MRFDRPRKTTCATYAPPKKLFSNTRPPMDINKVCAASPAEVLTTAGDFQLGAKISSDGWPAETRPPPCSTKFKLKSRQTGRLDTVRKSCKAFVGGIDGAAPRTHAECSVKLQAYRTKVGDQSLDCALRYWSDEDQQRDAQLSARRLQKRKAKMERIRRFKRHIDTMPFADGFEPVENRGLRSLSERAFCELCAASPTTHTSERLLAPACACACRCNFHVYVCVLFVCVPLLCGWGGVTPGQRAKSGSPTPASLTRPFRSLGWAAARKWCATPVSGSCTPPPTRCASPPTSARCTPTAPGRRKPSSTTAP